MATVTEYRCLECGMTWIWRNTTEGLRGYDRVNKAHDDNVRPTYPCRGKRKWGCTKTFWARGWKCGGCQTKYHEFWEAQRDGKA
ncbi:hypothetical protein SEA_JONJAMES_96 [Gordonia Phage JonJames]|nr:hypothetical protein SEA_JONJAMES_96 [Gordonia Phage JonJames]